MAGTLFRQVKVYQLLISNMVVSISTMPLVYNNFKFISTVYMTNIHVPLSTVVPQYTLPLSILIFKILSSVGTYRTYNKFYRDLRIVRKKMHMFLIWF